MDKVGVILGLLFCLGSVSALSFQDSNSTHFSLGSFLNTSYNGAVSLTGNNLSGTYTSRIFDPGSTVLWQEISSTFSNTTQTFLYIVDGSGSVYSSDNSSANWVKKNSGYGGTSDTQEMFSDGLNLYIVAGSNREVWKSNNSGVSWFIINDSFSSNSLNAGVADLSGNLYVSVGASTSAYGIYKSTNGGLTWNKVSNFSLQSNSQAKGMTVNATNALFLVAGSGYVFSSTDEGVTWNTTSSGYGRTTATEDMFSDGTNLYIVVGGTSKEVWKSNDSGVTWFVVNSTFTTNNLLVGEADERGNLYVVTAADDVYRSTNGGVGWSLVADFNGAATNDALGFASMPRNATLSFELRNCTFANCSDGVWQQKGLGSFLLAGRYFQYRTLFSSQGEGISALLYSLYVNYSWPDTTPPSFSVYQVSPSNSSAYLYNNSYSFNVTISDEHLETVLFTFDGVNYSSVTSLENISTVSLLNLSAGTHTYAWFANDTYGNANSSPTFSYVVVPDTQAPLLNLLSPIASQQYGYNHNLLLNFTVTDTNPLTCWYTLDSGTNTSLPSCSNSTFNVSEGNHTLTLYAQDVSGNLAFDTHDFSVVIGPPTVILIGPTEGLSVSDVVFSYEVEDPDGIFSCSLYGDFGQGFHLNQTNTSILLGAPNFFYVSLFEGSYTWAVICTDTNAQMASSPNQTFYVDTTSPLVTLVQPTGVKTSRTNIPLTDTVTDAHAESCWYHVYRGLALEIGNTTVNCSVGSSTFNVTVDADFVLNFYALDSVSNERLVSTSFSVSTSNGGGNNNGGGGGGGGGGGSGGGGGGAGPVASLEVNPLNLILSVGEEKSVLVGVKNKGVSAVNKCRLRTNAGFASFVESSDVFNIGGGEIVEFKALVNALDAKVVDLNLFVDCLGNVTAKIPLKVTLVLPDLDVKIKRIEFTSKSEMKVTYDILQYTPLAPLVFVVKDALGEEIARQEVTLEDEQKDKEDFVTFSLGDVENGLLKVMATDGGSLTYVEETIIYERGKGVTGFASLGIDGTSLSLGFIVLLFLVAVFFVVKHIVYLKKEHAEHLYVKSSVKKHVSNQ